MQAEISERRVKLTIERIVRVASLEGADRLDRADLEKDLNGNLFPLDRPMSPDFLDLLGAFSGADVR
jgi:hypothetical protein